MSSKPYRTNDTAHESTETPTAWQHIVARYRARQRMNVEKPPMKTSTKFFVASVLSALLFFLAMDAYLFFNPDSGKSRVANMIAWNGIILFLIAAVVSIVCVILGLIAVDIEKEEREKGERR